MHAQGKALFNLLRINWLEDPKIAVETWQVEDLRNLPVEELFRRLKELNISLTEETFGHYAENCDAPEELTECLWLDEEDVKGQDKAYLLIFELWRRLVPQKQTLSIFCDELDHLIALCDSGELEDEELLQDALSDLEDLIDEQVDKGAGPKDAFASISEYCAHDLESFIYDYISDQIDSGNETYASELLDGFFEAMSRSLWFKFLRARLIAAADRESATRLFNQILEELEDEPDPDLETEIKASI